MTKSNENKAREATAYGRRLRSTLDNEMRTRTTVLLILFSAILHFAIFFGRFIDPKPLERVYPTEEVIKDEGKGENYVSESGWILTSSIVTNSSTGKGWTEGMTSELDTVIKGTYTSSSDYYFRIRFGAFGCMLLASFILHVVMILTLKRITSNKLVGQIASS